MRPIEPIPTCPNQTCTILRFNNLLFLPEQRASKVKINLSRSKMSSSGSSRHVSRYSLKFRGCLPPLSLMHTKLLKWRSQCLDMAKETVPREPPDFSSGPPVMTFHWPRLAHYNSVNLVWATPDQKPHQLVNLNVRDKDEP